MVEYGLKLNKQYYLIISAHEHKRMILLSVSATAQAQLSVSACAYLIYFSACEIFSYLFYFCHNLVSPSNLFFMC
jgi:hypothetical protein